MIRNVIFLIGLAGAAGALPPRAAALAAAPEEKTSYGMSPDAWTLEPPIAALGRTAAVAKFARYEGMPAGTMTLNEGVAVLKTARFSTGAIDFDIKPIGYDDAGLVFHREGTAEGEFVYLRANPDCPAADDCIQYAPITKTMMSWNIYPNYQGPAPISPAGWNHIRIEIIGEGIRVKVNHAAEPSLVVPSLRGLRREGGLAFKGPAVFANLVVDSHAAGLAAIPPAPAAAGALTAWRAAPPTPYDRTRPVQASDIPGGDAWRPIEAEPTGLVNLGRAFGLAHAPSPSLAWLRTDIIAAAPIRRILRLGFAEQVWVFLNGQRIYAGSNQYFPRETRLSPDGRLEPDNASIALPLINGRNDIVLAVGNDWRSGAGALGPSQYGWAAEAHIDQTEGLDLR